MMALLPQPGGFEGLVLVVVLADANDHPVADREQLVVGRANLGTASCAAPDLARLHQHLIVSAVEDPIDLVSVVTETIEPLLQPLPDALATAIRRSVFRCAPFDIWMAERHRPRHCCQQVRLARGDLIPAPRYLDVLLHRLLSISREEARLLPQPGGFEGFIACAEDPYAEDSSGLNFVNDEHGAIDWHLADAPVGGDSTANHDFGPCVQKLLRVHVVSRQVSLR